MKVITPLAIEQAVFSPLVIEIDTANPDVDVAVGV
jgi:hypothetical protein